jgi:hypothetical protein
VLLSNFTSLMFLDARRAPAARYRNHTSAFPASTPPLNTYYTVHDAKHTLLHAMTFELAQLLRTATRD